MQACRCRLAKSPPLPGAKTTTRDPHQPAGRNVKGLAKRYGQETIRINAVCPGPTDTPMLRVFVANAALFLLADEASYVNGVALPVDGGATA